MYAHLCHLHEMYEFVYVCVFHAHVSMPVCKLCKMCFYTLHLYVVTIVLVECFSLCWKVISVSESALVIIIIIIVIKNKSNRYLPQCQTIAEKGYDCKTVELIVGSLGSVHYRF